MTDLEKKMEESLEEKEVETSQTLEKSLEKEQEQEQEPRTSQEAQALTRLLAIPEVREVIEARQRGERIRIIQGDEVEKPRERIVEPVEENVDFSMMSNKELAEYMRKEVVKEVSKLSNLGSRLDHVESVVSKVETSNIVKEINRARKAYADFDEYRDQMVALNSQNPNLTVDDLYWLAKKRSDGYSIPVDPRKMATEKPSVTPRASTLKSKQYAPGPQGLEQALDEVLGE